MVSVTSLLSAAAMTQKRNRDDEDAEMTRELLKRTSVHVRDLAGLLDEPVFPYDTPEYSDVVSPAQWMNVERGRIYVDRRAPRDWDVVLLKKESMVVIVSHSAVGFWPVYYDIAAQRPRTDFAWLLTREFDEEDVFSGTLDDVAGNFSVTMNKVTDAVNKATT
jgi:hypothetical protein